MKKCNDSQTIVNKKNYDYLKKFYDKYKKIEIIDKLLEKHYLHNSEKVIIDDIIIGIFDRINDPNSIYMSSSEYNNYCNATNNSNLRIGINIETTKQNIVIKEVIKNSPADINGLLKGDVIITLNDINVCDKIDYAMNTLRNNEINPITLAILRDNVIIKFNITKKKLSNQWIYAEILKQELGYIRLSKFNRTISDDFINTYKHLMDNNVKNIILDLRNNSGGEINEFLKIADYLIDDKIIFKYLDNAGIIKTKYSSKSSPNLPLWVLINEKTASSAEFLACALSDNNLCTLVGTKSFGKGTIQTTFALDNIDNSAVRITTSEVFRLNGDKLDKYGLTPDIMIKLDDKHSSLESLYNQITHDIGE